VSPMQVHPDFDIVFGLYDVMLFKIAPTTNVTPVELNTDPDSPVAGANVTAAGFGYYRNGAAVRPKYLQKVTLQAVPNDVCNALWKYGENELGFETSFQPEIMTCTMGVNPDGSPMGPCSGDSGGPLLDASGGQVGIVSYGGTRSMCSLLG
jgi:trypsin